MVLTEEKTPRSSRHQIPRLIPNWGPNLRLLRLGIFWSSINKYPWEIFYTEIKDKESLKFSGLGFKYLLNTLSL